MQILADKRQVVVFTHTLEGNTQKVTVGLQDALRHRVALHVLDVRNLLELARQRVVDGNRCRYRRLLGDEVGNLYVTAKAHHLVADGMLET